MKKCTIVTQKREKRSNVNRQRLSLIAQKESSEKVRDYFYQEMAAARPSRWNRNSDAARVVDSTTNRRLYFHRRWARVPGKRSRTRIAYFSRGLGFSQTVWSAPLPASDTVSKARIADWNRQGRTHVRDRDVVPVISATSVVAGGSPKSE